ncbi:MAG: ABC transporter ATP-binding protein, partial [Sulfuricurvum sp.]|nr:ABC transporter ATP-binding protein [Sulfuricurvum sp.]
TVTNLDKVHNAGQKNKFIALSGINFTAANGECVILKGVSGSGKSTLLSLLGGMSKPTHGSVRIEGHNIAKLPDDKLSHFRLTTVGFIFQSFNLIDDLSFRDNVLTPTICLNISGEEREKRFLKACELANISSKESTLAKDLSGGEKQRCAIARALINNPSLIIADEPTANLDKDNTLYFIETMKKLKKLGKTILIATHDEIFEQSTLVDRVIKIQYGHIVS